MMRAMAEEKRWGFLRPRWDLGLRSLAPEIRAVREGSPRKDLLAGLGASALVLPLGLFTAVDAGVAPVSAVVTLVVAGVLGTLLGGSRIGSSGPALAVSAALAALASAHGAATLGMACLLAGLLQLAFAVVGAGRVALLVPLGVTRGFVVGLGGALVLSALPHLLGVATPADLAPLEMLDHVGANIGHASGAGVAIAGATLAAGGIALRFAPTVPAAMVTTLLAIPLVWGLELDLPTLGEDTFVAPRIGPPTLPRTGIAAIIGITITIALSGSLETLLSSNAQREGDPERRGDPDQDLLANGLACTALAFLGGMPASASIARAAPLRMAQPTSRLAGLFVALFAGLVGVLFLLLGRFVPLAAIAAAVVVAAAPLLDPRPLVALVRASRFEGATAALTLVAILVLGLVAGAFVGLALALLVAVARVARSRASLHAGKAGAPHQLSLFGSLTFLAAPMLVDFADRLEKLDGAPGLVIDLRSVSFVDATGAARLVEITQRKVARGGAVALLGVSAQCRDVIVRADPTGKLEERFAISDKDVDRLLGRAGSFEAQAHVLVGLERFRTDVREHYSPLFDQLADGQSPHTLLITCVDSRVNPELLTGTHPGELFIIRSLGALVSPTGEDNLPSEAAAVEYAVGVLGVRNVIVCGHSQCGAIKALKSGHAPKELESLNRWLGKAETASGDLHGFSNLDDACRAATARQLANLRTIGQVKEREEKGELHLHAWFYDVGKAEVFDWDAKRSEYKLAGAESRASLPGGPPTPAPLPAN